MLPCRHLETCVICKAAYEALPRSLNSKYFKYFDLEWADRPVRTVGYLP